MTASADAGGPLSPAVRRLLAEQVTYYAARAPEYDATAYGIATTQDAERVDRRIATVLDPFAPFGDVLEVACGTGRWTAQIARRGRSVLAVDAAPPAVAIARTRVSGLRHVTLRCADALTWEPGKGLFDEVVMAFWLSHVPRSAWASFLLRTESWLRSGGRILIIDEHRDLEDQEFWTDSEVARRTLRDGSSFRIVKAHLDADRLLRSLEAAAMEPDDLAYDRDWLVASAVTRRR